MKNTRDTIIANDAIYQEETLEAIDVSFLHIICRQAIEQCIEFNERFARRFVQLKSEKPLDKRTEREWLVDTLDTWFTKRWNDKRRTDEAKKQLPPAKKSAPQLCRHCKKKLRCEDCEGDSHKVSPLLISSSNWEG
jgi:hypothetical protein